MKAFKILLTLVLLLHISCKKTELYSYPSSDSQKTVITSFRLVDATAISVVSSTTIDESAGTILVRVRAGTDVTKLYPSAVVSEGVVVDPPMGYPTNFSQPVSYRLLAGDRQTEQIWTITVIF